MKHLITFSCALSLSFSALWADLQWQITHGTIERGNVRLDSHKINIGVFPHYLDVEEEAVIATTGSLRRGGDRQTLEIYGTFTLECNSTLVGMLLWNGNVILKAKLKPNAQADDAYEDVVDRDTSSIPPPRRDPAIIERLDCSTYQIKIYPVTLGYSRKLRIRYHIPLDYSSGGWEFPISPIFSNSIPIINTTTQLELASNISNTQFNLAFGNNRFPVHTPSAQWIEGFRNFTLSYIPSSQLLFATTHFLTGRYRGHYLSFFSGLPEPLLQEVIANDIPLDDSHIDVLATLTSGGREIKLSPSCSERFVCAPLAFNGKSDQGWEPRIRWEISAWNLPLLNYEQSIAPTDTPRDTGMAVIWAGSGTSYSFVEEVNRGAVYGFIDERMSLLALEDDSLGAIEQLQWESAGVPRLGYGDIIPEDTVIPFTTAYPESGVIEITSPLVPRASLLDKLAVSLFDFQTALIELQLPEAFVPGKLIALALYNLKGIKLAEWNAPVSANRKIQMKVPELKPGHYLMRVTYENQVLFKKLNLN